MVTTTTSSTTTTTAATPAAPVAATVAAEATAAPWPALPPHQLPVLFYDTETTGLPVNCANPEVDVRAWPALVQLAYEVWPYEVVPLDCGAEAGAGPSAGAGAAATPPPRRVGTAPLASGAHLLLPPPDVPWSTEAEAKHGFSLARVMAEGVPATTALVPFLSAANAAALVVAHNAEFDSRMIIAAAVRAGLPIGTMWPLARRHTYPHAACTMWYTAPLLQLPYVHKVTGVPTGSRGKWPRLTDELYPALFGRDATYAPPPGRFGAGTDGIGAHDARFDVGCLVECFDALLRRGAFATAPRVLPQLWPTPAHVAVAAALAAAAPPYYATATPPAQVDHGEAAEAAARLSQQQQQQQQRMRMQMRRSAESFSDRVLRPLPHRLGLRALPHRISHWRNKRW